MEEKMCSKCHVVKKIDNFYRAGGSRLGWASECKECYKLRKRKKPIKKRKVISEEYLSELDITYTGLRIKCKVCQELKPSFRYYWNKCRFYRKCSKCADNNFRIPKILHESKWVINLEELKRREAIYLGLKINNDVDQKYENFLAAEKILKLVSRRRGLLEYNELFTLINTSLNIYDRISDTNDMHTEFVNMYNNILHYYRNYKQEIEK